MKRAWDYDKIVERYNKFRYAVWKKSVKTKDKKKDKDIVSLAEMLKKAEKAFLDKGKKKKPLKSNM
jgi:hypothetical protein